MEKKLGNEPAFPLKTNWTEVPKNNGMSKRFYAACAAMQGLIANSSVTFFNDERLVQQAYCFADELLKQENE